MNARPFVVAAGSAALAALLAGCGHMNSHEERDARVNVFPADYHAEIVAALHAYLADPTNIRDAFIAEPALKPVGSQTRYTVCVRYNARNSDGRYTGSRDVLAIFQSGRFDQFAEQGGTPPPTQSIFTPAPPGPARDLCAQADYKKFPDLEMLQR
jgi:hypothetical protein